MAPEVGFPFRWRFRWYSAVSLEADSAWSTYRPALLPFPHALKLMRLSLLYYLFPYKAYYF